MLALLVLAPKEAGQYTTDDLNLLAAFAQVTALALLLSAEGHRTIDALNRELKDKVEKIAEQQRRIVLLQSQIRVQGKGSNAAARTRGQCGNRCRGCRSRAAWSATAHRSGNC